MGETDNKDEINDEKQIATDRLKEKNRLGKVVGNLADNVKGAIKGNIKDIFVLKAKAIITIVLIVLIIAVAIIEGIAEETSDQATGNTASYYENKETSSAKLYNTTGSLLLATIDEIEEIKTSYLESIKGSKTGYYEAFQKKYKGQASDTVANKVTHITTNFATGETNDISKVDDDFDEKLKNTAASSSQDKSIYEHILMTEKYNFNDIVWRSFVKDERDRTSLIQEKIEFTVDEDSKLQYPVINDDATNKQDLTLDFYISRVRPYLQSWYIPFDIMVGTQDAQSTGALNTDLAYQIITNANHEIQLDRYKVENLERVVSYRVYDKKVEHTPKYETLVCHDECTEYQKIPLTAADENGDVYTYYVNGSCKEWTPVEDGVETTIGKTETVGKYKNLKEDLGVTDTRTYSWNYVISLAKMFDRIIVNNYTFNPYYEYDLTNYNNFIASDEDVNSYRQNEEGRYNGYKIILDAPSPYYKEEEKTYSTGNTPSYCGDTVMVSYTEKITYTGDDYTDIYYWQDELIFEDSETGIYNVESVKDVTGDDLTVDDEQYYNSLYEQKELNLFDLMNSNKEIYKEYEEDVENIVSTENIGIRRDALNISYNVLQKDLKELASEYKSSGLMYGNSLGILEGFDLSMIAEEGGINKAMVEVASQYIGKDLNYMLSLNHYNTFYRNHWCAMFVSYCMRYIDNNNHLNVKIPVPNYAACGEFWQENNTKPGFFDVQEWVQANPGRPAVQSDPSHIAPLSAIQPGDIVLLCYHDSPNRRDHTSIVKSVEKDENGNVTKITTIDGNWDGIGENSFNNSKVKEVEHTNSGLYDLGTIASFVSISTVMAEAEQGNIW